jgi:hypothetical protein
MAMMKNYWRMTWRNLKKHPGYTAINVIGLAVGLACCLVILTWCRSELSFDRFHADSDRLYLVFTKWNEGEYGKYLPGPLAAHLKQSFPEIAEASVFSESSSLKVSYGPDKGVFAASALVEPSFLKMFTSSAFRSSALDGIQPTLRQTPPQYFFSTMAVLKPNWAARIAAT